LGTLLAALLQSCVTIVALPPQAISSGNQRH